MKTVIAWILTAVLCLSVLTLVGCKGKIAPETEAPVDSDSPVIGQVAGGWTVSSEPVSPVISDEAKEAFDAATAELTGVAYEPIAFLGSQVVAGFNYAYLCRSTTVAEQPVTGLSIVKVYRDLEDNASILNITDISIADYTDDSDIAYIPGDLCGGWGISVSTVPAALPENVQTAFDKALADYSGVGFTPVAYLGSQVVAGANYAVLCTATSMTAEPQFGLAVVVIYADLEGGAEITSVSGVDFP